MARLQATPESISLFPGTAFMHRASASFISRVRLSHAIFRRHFCAPPSEAPADAATGAWRPGPRRSARAAAVGVSAVQLKEDWLRSISCPFPEEEEEEEDGRLPGCGGEEEEAGSCAGLEWVVGIDPDVSGALALLKGDTAQVFDNPRLKVLVGKTLRKRLDARSIVQLLHSFGAPRGTTAYIEQSIPFPQDGKQGWWSGGYTYGLWIGVLVATGFSVVPVSSRTWKDHFHLQGNPSCKDASREAAIALFPSLSSQLKRKKDHGRAEALLIAAYGKGLRK